MQSPFDISKLIKTGILLTFLMFFDVLVCQSQKTDFDATITEERLTFEGVARKGFSTHFDKSANTVEKGWWRYAREFGRPLNMKSYYQVTIPSSENNGTVDIILLSKTMANRDGSKFFLTIKDDNIPTERIPTYLEQVKLILQDFKKHFYIKRLEEQIEEVEKEAKRISKKVDKGETSIKVLMKKEQQLEALQEELKDIYLTWG